MKSEDFITHRFLLRRAPVEIELADIDLPDGSQSSTCDDIIKAHGADFPGISTHFLVEGRFNHLSSHGQPANQPPFTELDLHRLLPLQLT